MATLARHSATSTALGLLSLLALQAPRPAATAAAVRSGPSPCENRVHDESLELQGAAEAPVARRHAQAGSCDSMLASAVLSEFTNLIRDNKVMVFGVPNTRCLLDGVASLESRGACHTFRALTNQEWAYFKCKHPNELVGAGRTPMHSYFYTGGVFRGNGYRMQPGRLSLSLTSTQLTDALRTAGASLACKNDGAPASHPKLATCRARLTGSMLSLDQITAKISGNPVMLFGWTSCPCTGIANARFDGNGLCFEKVEWAASSEPLMAFFNCLYGSQHHSFIFIGQRFVDNGFRFADTAMGNAELQGLVTAASARASCGPAGEPFFNDFSSLITHNPAQKNYGVAVTDIDHDGAFELVVAGFGVANLALKWNSTAKRFDDIALGNPTLQDASHSAIGLAACDIDGDGREELYVLNTDQYSGSTSTSDRLLRRGATGEFSNLFEQPRNAKAANYIAGRSCACTDRDGDGKYGVFVSNYGGPMKLYELDASDMLVDVAPALGLAKTTGGRALISAPLRSSHRMDIFANNENGCNYFWRNTGTGFVEEAASLGIADCHNTGRGTTVLDADADGVLDIVWGNWMGQHRLFIQEAAAFVDRAPASMSAPSRVRTVIAADWDNDGEEELFYNNIPDSNRLFVRAPDGQWVARNIGAALEPSGHGTGAAVGDFDGDGQLELLISHGESASEPLTYYRPRAGKRHHWLRIAPLTQQRGPARGAVVRMVLKGAVGDGAHRTYIRAIDAGSGYLCQMEPVAHFGLGNATSVSEVEVTWPDGSQLRIRNPRIDKMHRVPHPLPRTTSSPTAVATASPTSTHSRQPTTGPTRTPTQTPTAPPATCSAASVRCGDKALHAGRRCAGSPCVDGPADRELCCGDKERCNAEDIACDGGWELDARRSCAGVSCDAASDKARCCALLAPMASPTDSPSPVPTARPNQPDTDAPTSARVESRPAAAKSRFVVTLATTVETIPPGSAARTRFVTDFTADVGVALGVDASAVHVLGIRAASVAVDFEVVSTSGKRVDVLGLLSRSTLALAGMPVELVAAVSYEKESETPLLRNSDAQSGTGATSSTTAWWAVVALVAAVLVLVAVGVATRVRSKTIAPEAAAPTEDSTETPTEDSNESSRLSFESHVV